MKKITLLISFFLSAFCVSAQQKPHAEKQAPKGIESVQIFRTGCHGKCPTYSVEIDKDGKVTYIAIRFCGDSGTFNKNIGAAKATEILNKVSAYRLDTCKDVYPNLVPDQSGLIYTIKYKNKVKNIRNAKFGPAFLVSLAKDIDDAGKKTDNNGWKKGIAAQKEINAF